MAQRLIYGIDQLSRMVGHVFAWCIVILTIGTCYEVFVRYVLRAPTSWAFDMSYLMYGAVFFMAGAYTLAQDGHVRGDFLYGNMRPRLQASLDLALSILFLIGPRKRLAVTPSTDSWVRTDVPPSRGSRP